MMAAEETVFLYGSYIKEVRFGSLYVRFVILYNLCGNLEAAAVCNTCDLCLLIHSPVRQYRITLPRLSVVCDRFVCAYTYMYGAVRYSICERGVIS